ncbi:MAG: AAA family ATPase [Denitrovibrio sp.]|nr:MAG: AAA family ATPase [Denitrovibrio sp.]
MKILEELRPKVFDDIVGQKHLTSNDTVFRKMVEDGGFDSLILVGPPGTGKTTIAEIICNVLSMPFFSLHAATAGAGDLKQIMESAKHAGKTVLVFVDELHRFNKTQQVLLLNMIDTGLAKLIGASTENPYHNLIHPLRSRSFVFRLERLERPDYVELYNKVKVYFKERYKAVDVLCSDEEFERLVKSADGDGRRFLSVLELSAVNGVFKGDVLHLGVGMALEHTTDSRYNADEHYDMLSAMIKSIRGTDPDAALIWGFRLLECGMEPEAIFRRLLISASEDIGNAYPDALVFAQNAYSVFQAVGRPEGDIIFAHAITYLASCPKSNRSYKSMWAVKGYLENNTPNVPYPITTEGKGYKYPFDFGGFVKQEYSGTDELFYDPSDAGFEVKIAERLKKLWGNDKAYGKKSGEKGCPCGKGSDCKCSDK